jgi:bifunctional DNA-binding transcriptional regulator/antitoxin component of YhaV-PrlF toxin-antitoxin module
MSKSNERFTYEVIVQDAGDDSGDVLLPIPTELLSKLGWHEGDNVDFSLDDRGRIILKRIS